MAELIQVPFTRGVDEAADPKGLAPGTPLAIENGYFDKTGRLVTRPGMSALAATTVAGGTITAGERLITRGDDLCVFDGTYLYAYSSTLAKWQEVDRPSPLSVRRRMLADSAQSIRLLDCALQGSLLVLLYSVGTSAMTTDASCYVEVQNVDTGATALEPTLVASSKSFLRVLINGAGTTAILIVGDNTIGNLDAYTLTLSSMTLSAATALVGDGSVSAQGQFDAVIGTNGATETLYVVRNHNINGVTVESFNASTLAAIASDSTSAHSGRYFCIDTDDTNVVVVYGNNAAGGDTYVMSMNMNLGGVVGPTSIAAANSAAGTFVRCHDADEFIVGYTDTDGAGTAAQKLTTHLMDYATLSATTGTSRTTYNVTKPSKPWKIGSRYYVAVCTYVSEYVLASTQVVPNVSSVVLEIVTSDIGDSQHKQVATLENYIGWPTATGHLTQPAEGSDGRIHLPVRVRHREPTNRVTEIPTAWALHTFDTADPRGPTAQLGGGVLVPAGAPYWYDGATASPYGFAHPPMIVAAPAASAGGSIVAGTYGYKYLYAWRDALGLLHRSTVSASRSGTTAGANLTLPVKVATASLSRKAGVSTDPDRVMCEVYRTVINGATYYCLTYPPDANVLLNDPAAGDVTLTDTRADANITGSGNVALSTQAQPYTATGELDDIPPPAALAALSHKDRLWVLASDGHTLWASKSFVDDPTVAPGFNEVLTQYFAPAKEALGALDEAVVVFGETTIDLVYGDGPDATGVGGWTRRSVQTDVGTTNPRSVATVPPGLVFASTRGIEMLSRSLEISWIGEPVKDTLADFPTITSAVVVPAAQHLRISCTDSGGTDSRVLVWDYRRNAWFVWDYNFVIVDAALVDGTYTLLRSNGVVYQERAASSRDGTTFVGKAVEMVVQPSGPNAWHRLKAAQLLGTSQTPHTLTMKVRRDFDADYEYTHTFASATEVTDEGPLQKARIVPKHQKAQGFVLRIEETVASSDDTADAGTGAIWEQVALYVQRKEGPAKVSGRQRG